jgi:hypothetical protein
MQRSASAPWATCSWFKVNGTDDLDYMNVAIPAGVFRGLENIPPGWLKPARKQLPADELDERFVITWDVPAADLQSLFRATRVGQQTSSTLYMAGTGVHLQLQTEKEEGDQIYTVCTLSLQTMSSMAPPYAQQGWG